MSKVFANKLVSGKAIGAQPTFCDDHNLMQDIIQNFKVVQPLKLDQNGIDWRLSLDKDEATGAFNPDDVSLENVSGKAQMLDFDTGPHVGLGLTDCLTVDPKTGVVSAKGGGQYEIPVRVKNADGTYAALGYMPIGSSDGEDPDGTGDNNGGYDDECSHTTNPDGGGGGGGPASNEGDQPHDPKTLPDGSGEGDGMSGYDDHEASDPPNHPGKTGVCW